MAFSEREVLTEVRRLTVTRLQAWIESGWVRPVADDGGRSFSDTDVARLRLLCTLADDLALDDEALPVVLHLLDQLHGTRVALRGLVEAVEQQPAEVRQEIVEVCRQRIEG